MISLQDVVTSVEREFLTKDFMPSNQLDGRVVFITGGAGSIGSALVLQSIARNASKVIVLDSSEINLYHLQQTIEEVGVASKVAFILGDYGDDVMLKRIYAQYKVDTLIHAGAYKHVPMLQFNVRAAVTNNVVKAVTLFKASAKIPEWIIISTDKACNPSNSMGYSKLIVEHMATFFSGGDARIVRFGNVLGSSGSVVPLFYKQVVEGKGITLTHAKMKRYFMSVEQATDLVLNTLSLPAGKYVLDMGEQVLISKLAEYMIKLMGKEVPIVEVGIRSGEKLEEELYLAQHEETSEVGIMEVCGEDNGIHLHPSQFANLNTSTSEVIYLENYMQQNFNQGEHLWEL